MAMVRFLVEEERLGVNQMDTDEQLANHWGVPILYEAKDICSQGARTRKRKRLGAIVMRLIWQSSLGMRKLCER